MKRALALSIILGVGALSMSAAGYQNPQPPPALEIQKVKDNLYMVVTPNFGAGNTAVFITDAGVVLVDTKTPGNGPGIIDKVKSVTNKPITMVINTHTHADHTGSNDAFTGKVEFIAHKNTKANMMKMDAFKGDNAKFLPSKTYDGKLKLGSGKDAIELHYLGPAHTNGDTFVVFPALRAMHSGDAFAGKNVPLIDADNGGSAVEYSDTIAKAAKIFKDVDTIITGHSALMKPADLQEYADFNQEFIAWVKTEIRYGKTTDQMVKDFKLPERYKDYRITEFFGGIKGNIELAYKELKKK